ncbi:MAG: hypothetical protein ACE3JK_18635 [Sporolactobacillus sp.]
MERFAFYEEYDGKGRQLSKVTHPKKIIEAESMLNAIHVYCLVNDLEISHVNRLPEQDARIYLFRRSLLGEQKNFIFYVRHLTISRTIEES